MPDVKRKPYGIPDLKKVKLIPKEAILGNCKSTNGTNRATGKCESLENCPNNAVAS